MGKLFELLVFLNVNEELGQPVKNQLSLINEDVNFVLEELLAVLLEILRHGGAEHHDLLVVGSLNEDFLYVGSHAWVAHDFIALVNHEEFNLDLNGLVPFRN